MRLRTLFLKVTGFWIMPSRCLVVSCFRRKIIQVPNYFKDGGRKVFQNVAN